MDFGQMQYKGSLIDIIYLCVVLGRWLELYENYVSKNLLEIT